MLANGVIKHANPRTILGHVKSSPFLKHNAIFFSGSMLVAALNYVYYPVLGRLMKPAEFGEVQTLTSLFMQAAIFFSIISYVTIHVTVNAVDEHERNHTLLGLERFALLIGYTFLAIALLFTDELKTFLNFTDIWPFVALIAALAIGIPAGFRTAFLRGSKRFARSSLSDAIGSASKLFFSVIFVLAGLKSFGAMLGIVVAQIIVLALLLNWAHKLGFRGFGLRTKGAKLDKLRPQLKYASAVLLASLSIVILLTLGTIAIKHYFPPHEAGLYAGVATAANIIYFLMAPITGVMVASISLSQHPRKNKIQFGGSVAIMTLLGGTALLIMTLFPELIIKILVGSDYLKFSDYLPRVGLTMLFLGLANVFLLYKISLRQFMYGVTSFICMLGIIILVGVRHSSVLSVINDILLGSAGLLALLGVQSFITSNTTNFFKKRG